MLIMLLWSAWSVAPGTAQEESTPTLELVQRFKATADILASFELAKEIVALGDSRVLGGLEDRLSHEDRRLRGNAAYIFAALGEDRGWEVLGAILAETVESRSEAVGMPVGDGHARPEVQLVFDRYYAVHLLGLLGDPRALPHLLPLLENHAVNQDVNYKVVWALGEIGGGAAIAALIGALEIPDPDVRVIAIQSLATLEAKEALPHLEALLQDQRRSTFGPLTSVAEAAEAAIAAMETP